MCASGSRQEAHVSDSADHSKPSRRQFLGTATAAGAIGAALATISGDVTAVAQAPGTTPPAAVTDTPDLFLTNGRIHTLDAGNRVVSAVWIRNGRILGAGDRAPR